MVRPTDLHRIAQEKILCRHDMGGSAESFARSQAANLGLQIPAWEARGDPVRAVVNSGRWLVNCPSCAGAEYADPSDRLFWCASCWNIAQDHYPRPVEWPRNAKAIERELIKRPGPHLPGSSSPRNWVWGETIAQLQMETTAGRDIPAALHDRITEA